MHLMKEQNVKEIVRNCFENEENTVLESYIVYKASDKMLGFLSDYWKLQVRLLVNKMERKSLYFFIKSISTSNEAKAKMVKEMKLFEKELYFYNVIKRQIGIPDLRPWSATLITTLDEAMVFEDLNAMQYKTKNKFDRFDEAHTLQALSTLARFHASSIVYEERKSKKLSKKYCINEEFENYLNQGGYNISDQWFVQCMTGALQAVKKFSKYGKDKSLMNTVENKWKEIWHSGLKLSDFSPKRRCVICHRDLWNNNILFRYKELSENKMVPVDCLLVDFQAVRYQEPAGDVMLLLYCNLDPIYRETNMQLFLNYYYQELEHILSKHDIKISDIFSKDSFICSAEEQRLWGLIVSACLTPQFWLDETLTTQFFCDTEQFNQILSKNKGAFINKMIEENEDYKSTVLCIFEEIVERYCLN